MATTTSTAIEKLLSSGLKPSVQRVAILDYLMAHHTHPTVDEIYAALSRKMPTLSKTTVYNTLRLLSDNKAAQMLTIDDHHVCYDGDTSPHVHFFCKRCGRILDIKAIAAPTIAYSADMDGNQADEVQLFYKGVCAACLEKERKTNEQ